MGPEPAKIISHKIVDLRVVVSCAYLLSLRNCSVPSSTIRWPPLTGVRGRIVITARRFVAWGGLIVDRIC